MSVILVILSKNCDHCKIFKGNWERLQTSLRAKGYQTKTLEINSLSISEIPNKYAGIKSYITDYPTILLMSTGDFAVVSTQNIPARKLTIAEVSNL